MVEPKIGDTFRFDDGTIGQIVSIHEHLNQECIEVQSRKYGFSTFAISSLCFNPGIECDWMLQPE